MHICNPQFDEFHDWFVVDDLSKQIIDKTAESYKKFSSDEEDNSSSEELSNVEDKDLTMVYVFYIIAAFSFLVVPFMH